MHVYAVTPGERIRGKEFDDGVYGRSAVFSYLMDVITAINCCQIKTSDYRIVSNHVSYL